MINLKTNTLELQGEVTAMIPLMMKQWLQQSVLKDAIVVSKDAIKLLQQASSHDNYLQFARGRQVQWLLHKRAVLGCLPS